MAEIRVSGGVGGLSVALDELEAAADGLGRVATEVGEVAVAVGLVGVDPRLFRTFSVDAVPAYVVTATDFDLCDGFECRTELPPHDRIGGNVTLRHALDAFAAGGGPAAQVAAVYRARLGQEVR